MSLGAHVGPVRHVRHAALTRAVGTAEDFLARRDAVTDDPALTVAADGRQIMDCAFKAVVGSALPIPDDIKRMDIVISANLADRHDESLRV